MRPAIIAAFILISFVQTVRAGSSEDLIPLNDDQLYCYQGGQCIRARQRLSTSNVFGITTTAIQSWDPRCFGGEIRHYSWSPIEGMLLHGVEFIEWDVFYTVAYDPPRLVLPPEITVGQTWSNHWVASCTQCPDFLTGSFSETHSIEAQEDVQVPYGEFLAYKVVTERTDSTRDIWYAPGIGEIKYYHHSEFSTPAVLVSNCPNGVSLESRTWTAVKAMY